MARVHIIKADITMLDVDAIVNPANESLIAGGGLCGYIHKMAGKQLEEECISLSGCTTGQAVITNGYNLKASHVIHAVSPHYYRDHDNAPELLESCYRNALKIANLHKLKSIAIPAISTGICRYPIMEASNIAFITIRDFLQNENKYLTDIALVVTTDALYQTYIELHKLFFKP
jgi:O-acetyl-ADP-ribose deacetylase